MKTLLKTAARALAALMICVTVSACTQPTSLTATGFPTSGVQAASPGALASPSIMDY